MDNDARIAAIQEDQRKKSADEILAKIKAIAIHYGIADANGMIINLPKFKKHPNLMPEKYSGRAGYKVYFGVPGWDTIGLIEYFPYLAVGNKTRAVEMFWGELKLAINSDCIESIECENLCVRQKISIGWL